MQTVIVVTNPELGWDCVVGVYASEEDAENENPTEDGYIHTSAMVD